MLSFISWMLIASAVSCEVSEREPTPGDDPTSPQECCKTIQLKLPSIVHFPDSEEYQERHTTYYSLQQQELFPACTVKPTSAKDVSFALQIAEAGQCRFAVASGGHMAWKGSSNIQNGFVFDFRGLDGIEISSTAQTAKLGTGSTWARVYKTLAPFDVTVAGARINNVGGFAFKSQVLGFGADSVYNYEVVLSNGSIIDANKGSHSDLFWALKLAGTNYGIVTRFDMHTYPSPAIWGFLALYPVTEQSVLEVFADYETYSHDNNNPNVFQSAVFVKTAAQDALMSVMVNTDGMAIDPPTKVQPLQTAEEIGSTHDVVNDVIAGALNDSARAAWYTLTTKVNTQFILDIYKKAGEVFQPIMDRDGLSIAVSAQAFQKSFIDATRGSPVFNSMNGPGEDLTLTLLMITWTNRADDEAMKEATNKLGRLAEDEAHKRGILTAFLYPNYANGEQDIYGRSVTPGDLAKLQQIRNVYDPKGTFQQLWKGGYKIPEKPGQRGRERDEL
ncbi:hypothetical protein GE09DRAFT_1215197 [Coniochaeta sp. 2T2.1]|nr:hypothetical protein GE09DRAFT_1215197 [Coniochaeta sp. 2T2.1]